MIYLFKTAPLKLQALKTLPGIAENHGGSTCWPVPVNTDLFSVLTGLAQHQKSKWHRTLTAGEAGCLAAGFCGEGFNEIYIRWPWGLGNWRRQVPPRKSGLP